MRWAFLLLPLIQWLFVTASRNRMSKYQIVEGHSRSTGQPLFQVFIGGMTVGNPWPSREQAEQLIKTLEQREADDEAEAQRQREAEAVLRRVAEEEEEERQRSKRRSGPSFGM